MELTLIRVKNYDRSGRQIPLLYPLPFSSRFSDSAASPSKEKAAAQPRAAMKVVHVNCLEDNYAYM